MKLIISIILLIMTLGSLPGCQPVKYSTAQEAKYRKPVITVSSFENRAAGKTRWKLGDDMADQLIERLIETRRYTVLDRQSPKSFFRRGSETSRTNPVQYTIKGTITDFGFIESGDGMKRVLEGDWFGKNRYAFIGATLYVLDAPSGQILVSKRLDAKVKAGKVPDPKKEKNKVKDSYDTMAFGSNVFYQTPMGQATARVLDQAVNEIVQAISEQPFQPKVSSVLNGQVIINGGKDRRMEVGREYVVRPRAQAITDPDTGDILGNATGDIIGRIRVTQVTEKYSIATILFGEQFEPGQTLFPANPRDPAVLPKAPVVRSY